MKSKNSDKGGNHKQYTLDRILVTGNGLIKNPDIRNATQSAGDIKWLFQNYKQKTAAGLNADQIKQVRKWLSRSPNGDKNGIKASLGLESNEKYNTVNAEKDAKKYIDIFNMKTLFQDSSSTLVEHLFDMNNYSVEEKDRMKIKIKELVEDILPEDISVDG